MVTWSRLEKYGEPEPIKAPKLICIRTLRSKAIKSPNGTYSLYTIPEDKEWTVIFNSKLHTWGHYDYDPSFDVLRFKVPIKNANQIREHFGIAFAGENGSGRLFMAWDQTGGDYQFHLSIASRRSIKKL